MSITHQSFIEKKFFENLDGIRAFSIIAVIWHHSSEHLKEVPLHLLTQGNHGVTLFFVLSGFLITTLLLREKKRYQTVNLRKFYMRRTLRIFPLYYFVILFLYVPLVYFVEADPIRKSDFWNNLPYFLTYTGNILANSTTTSMIFLYSWSLAVEEQFYLVWPTLEKFISTKVMLIGLPIVIFALCFIQSPGQTVSNSFQKVVEHISPAILMGVLTAHLLNEKVTFNIISKFLGNSWAFIVSLIGLLVSLEFTHSTGFFIYFFSSLMVISSVINQSFFGSSTLKNKVLIEIGKVSYGIYLYHMLCINIVKKGFRLFSIDISLLNFIASTVLAFFVSYLSFHYFEKYFINLKQKYSV